MRYSSLQIMILIAEGGEVRYVTIILIPEVGWFGMCDLTGITRRFGLRNNDLFKGGTIISEIRQSFLYVTWVSYQYIFSGFINDIMILLPQFLSFPLLLSPLLQKPLQYYPWGFPRKYHFSHL